MTKKIFSDRLSTVHNAIIQLGDTDDSGKGRHFKSRFIQPGVAGYPGQFGNVLITKETLDKFIKTMVGVPVIINHKDITDKNADEERVGVVNSVWYDNKDGWYWCDGIIWNETAQNLITDKNWSVSCSYNVITADNEGGSENNIKYDMEFLDGVFTHLALVNNPRYERANIVFNSKTEFINVNNEDKWITVHPNGEENTGKHLLIKEGETVQEALQRTYGIDGAKGQQKLFDTSGDRKTKEDFRREAAEKQAKYDEHQKQVQKRYDYLQYLGTAEPDKWEELGEPEMTFEKWESQREAQKQSDTKDGEEDFAKRENKQSDTKEEKNKYLKKGDLETDKVYKLGKLYVKPFVDDEGDLAFFDRTGAWGEGSLPQKFLKSDLKNLERVKKYDKLTDKELKFLSDKEIINNSKEQDMALIEELKKLITKVENDKGDNMINNEKEDKRKLIDEVGGILKGKVDDEIIRTIIKKMEEASYNESEDGSADNKKVKNEDDKDEKEVKNKKVKNEDDKDEKEVKNKKVKNEDEEDKEEDKKEVKEIKEDVKEDVDNKCKNSKDDFFERMNKIYNSAVKPDKSETEYVSRADRLKAGEEYFKV